MFAIAFILLSIAALGGMVLAAIRARSDANPPMVVAVVHGVVAASGLVTLLVYDFQMGFPALPTAAAGFFVVAALGGAVLFSTHLRGTLISLGLVAVHASAAVVGYVLLIWALLAGRA